MNEKVKIGIIICDRYRSCAGGKCFRSLRNREGAFSVYKDKDVEVVAMWFTQYFVKNFVNLSKNYSHKLFLRFIKLF